MQTVIDPRLDTRSPHAFLIMDSKLNHDIFLNIIYRSAYSPGIGAALMATCRFLYHEGAKAVLRTVPIHITSTRGVKSFILFLRAEELSRFELKCTFTV